MTDISIIIVNYNGEGFIEGCLESIYKKFAEGDSVSFETIVVDNASSDSSRQHLEEICTRRDLRLVKNVSNLGFGAASNRGAGQAGGEYLLFLNPDCRIIDSRIGQVLDFYRDRADAGVLGVKVQGKNGRIQYSPRAFPTLARQFYESYFLYRFRASRILGSYFMTWWDHSSPRQVDWLSGSFMLIKKSRFMEIGGFDRDYFMYSEDTALCLDLARKGYRNYYYPHYMVEHADAGIASRDMASRQAQVWQSRRIYFSKNYSQLHGVLFSLIYLAGMLNRVMVFVAAALFSRGSGKRALQCLRTLYIYYFKKKRTCPQAVISI